MDRYVPLAARWWRRSMAPPNAWSSARPACCATGRRISLRFACLTGVTTSYVAPGRSFAVGSFASIVAADARWMVLLSPGWHVEQGSLQ